MPAQHLYGCWGPEFGPQVCTPSAEPFTSLILLYRAHYKVCVRGMPLSKETFLDFTNPGASGGENLPLPVSSHTVSLLLLFNCVSTIS